MVRYGRNTLAIIEFLKAIRNKGNPIYIHKDKIMTEHPLIFSSESVEIKKRWEKATELRCPHLRHEENYFSYRNDEPPSFWIALDKDPCPKCKNRICHNYGQKFHESKRLIIFKENK